jgi:peptide/nickel transport system substrate-binding protein
MTAVGVVVALVAALTACSTGSRVDLGGESAGNLVAAIAGEPDQLDPQKTSAYFSFEVLENVFDTLVAPDANLEMRPALAESWDVSPDQLMWTFHVRRGVTFHDGSPFTADDVVYSYRRIIDQKLANADKFSAVTAVTKLDASTVKITLKQPTPNLLTNLGGFKGVAIVQRVLGWGAECFGCDVPFHLRIVHGAVRLTGRRDRLDGFHSAPTRRRAEE